MPFDNRDRLFEMDNNFKIGDDDVYQLFFDYYISKKATLRISESELSEFIAETQNKIADSIRALNTYWQSLVSLKQEIKKMDIFKNGAQKQNYFKGFLNNGIKYLNEAIELEKKIAEKVTDQELLQLIELKKLRTNLIELLETYKNPRDRDEMLSIYKKMFENDKSIELFKKYSDLRKDESI